MAKQEQQLVWSDYGFSFKLFCAILFRSGHTFPGGVNQMGSVSHMINVRRGKHIVGGGVQIPRASLRQMTFSNFVSYCPGQKRAKFNFAFVISILIRYFIFIEYIKIITMITLVKLLNYI